VTPLPVRLPDDGVWLRLAEPEWEDPLDPSFAAFQGGRWNAPGSYPALYRNDFEEVLADDGMHPAPSRRST
jgi:hypothetical protein